MVEKWVATWKDEFGNVFFFPDQSEVFDREEQALSYQHNTCEMIERIYGVKPSGTLKLVADKEDPEDLQVMGVILNYGPDRQVISVAGPLFEEEKPVIH